MSATVRVCVDSIAGPRVVSQCCATSTEGVSASGLRLFVTTVYACLVVSCRARVKCNCDVSSESQLPGQPRNSVQFSSITYSILFFVLRLGCQQAGRIDVISSTTGGGKQPCSLSRWHHRVWFVVQTCLCALGGSVKITQGTHEGHTPATKNQKCTQQKTPPIAPA